MSLRRELSTHRRSFIGGSDARIIMGSDEAALIRLWQEKRGEAEPEDFSDNLIVQLGRVTEDLNRHWFERNTGQTIKDVQRRIRHPVNRWMGATLDGLVAATGAVFEAKFMLPWSFSEDGAAEKHMAQLQHNMWVVNAKMAALSIITGGGKWVEIDISADPLYQHLLITAERKFWRCVETGKPPGLFAINPPRPRITSVRVVEMTSSNSPGAPFAVGQPGFPLSPVGSIEADPLATLPRVDKSVLPIGAPRRHRDEAHLGFVASHPCIVCGRKPADAHHLRFAQHPALGRKVSDEYTVPLCRSHHRELHRTGNEYGWWRKTGIDPLQIALRLWNETLSGRGVLVEEQDLASPSVGTGVGQ
jgi:YqaJ-like viral recombinase domain